MVHYSARRCGQQWRYSLQNRRTRKDHVNFVTPIGGYYEMLQEEQPPFFFQGYLHEYTWACGVYPEHVEGFRVTIPVC